MFVMPQPEGRSKQEEELGMASQSNKASHWSNLLVSLLSPDAGPKGVHQGQAHEEMLPGLALKPSLLAPQLGELRRRPGAEGMLFALMGKNDHGR